MSARRRKPSTHSQTRTAGLQFAVGALVLVIVHAAGVAPAQSSTIPTDGSPTTVVSSSAAATTAVPLITTTGPEVLVEPAAATAGEQLTLTIGGFRATSVTISICGNGALRGSADCNMIASTGLRLNRDGTPTVAVMPVSAPPMPCPCVVRVSSPSNDEIAVSPLDLIGHPVDDTVDSGGLDEPLDVSISALRSPQGLLARIGSSLGASTPYEVTISVKNASTAALSSLAVSATLGRDEADVITAIPLADPDVIGAGRTWQQVASVEVPGREFGELTWRLEVSGAGPTVAVSTTTRHRPALLMVLVVLVVLDVAFVIIRSRVRRHAALDSPTPT